MCVKTAEHNTVSPNIYFFVKKSSMYKFTLLCFTTNVECLICQLLDDSIILSWVLHFSQNLYAEKKLVRLALSHTSVHVDFTEFSKMPDCHLRPSPSHSTPATFENVFWGGKGYSGKGSPW